PGGPDGAVGVLAAVLPDALGVGADVAGVGAPARERRREQLDDAVLVVDQVLLGRGHAQSRPGGVGRAREDRPGLRDDVDLALGLPAGAERRAVVVEGPDVA